MTQLLAIATRINKKTKAKSINNFDCEKLSLNVKIRGPARKTYKIPKAIRGKTFTIKRLSFKDWPTKKGDFVILTPDESKRCIYKLTKRLKIRKWKNFIKDDINGDGFYEIMFHNPFIKTTISPHYGARLWQFWNRETGKNELFGEGNFKNKGYIELGGIEETLSKDGTPDELWNTAFRSKKCQDDDKLAFFTTLKKEKEISIDKQFAFFDDFPCLIKTLKLTYKPKKKKDNKKTQKRRKIELKERVFFAMGGIPDFYNIYYIPTRDKMNRIRFNKPFFKRGWGDHPWWEWTHLFFSPTPGFIILRRENTNDIILIFFSKKKTEYIWTGDKKRTPRFLISYKQEHLQPKKPVEYQSVIAAASSFSFSRNEVLFASIGKSTKASIPVSFVYYSARMYKKKHITLVANGMREKVLMKKLKTRSIQGNFFFSTRTVNRETKSIKGIVNNGKLKVRLNLD